MIVLDRLPEVVTIRVTSLGDLMIIEAIDPATNLIAFGGPMKEVINWMGANGFRYVKHSRGVWSQEAEIVASKG